MEQRPPRHPALRAVVRTLWSTTPLAPPPAPRERVLPTGAFHLALRLEDAPLRLFASEGDPVGKAIGTAIVGGVRTSAWLRDVARPVASVGAQLHVGAAPLLFGVAAHELAEAHLPLEALWGGEVEVVRERLAGTPPAERLDRFEAWLASRVAPERGVHPAIARAIARLDAGAAVGAVVAESGWSHRHFIERFRQAAGLAPAAFAAVRRLQRALRARSAAPDASWAEIALAAGYADQAHLTRAFRRIAGLPPGAWARIEKAHPNHVPMRPRAGG